jgi:tripartite ATP-independent transporter DctP family solute receptor
MKNNPLYFVTVLLVLSMLLSACGSKETAGGTSKNGGSGNSEGEKFILRLGHVGSADSNDPWEKFALELNKRVQEKSDGRLSLQTYPGSQLGADREMIEGMQQGTMDLGLIGTIAMTNFVPDYQVWDLPYIFPQDYETADKITDGPIGDQLAEKAEEKGLVMLGYWDHSFRSMSNGKKPIKTFEDLKGLRMRVVENAPSIDWFGRIGTTPTPMAFSELYTALQQGTVDGQDNGPVLTYNTKLYEVQPYYTLTRHMYSVLGVVASKKVYDKLPGDLQGILKETVAELTPEQREYSRKTAKELLGKMADAGIQITELSAEEIAKFEKSAVATHRELAPKIGQELVDKMMEYRK